MSEQAPSPDLRILSVLVENKPRVLARIAGLFARRGFNIHSLAVAPTDHPDVSRMTIVVDGTSAPIEQITKHLHKLINVIKVTELAHDDSVERELMLVQIEAEPDSRAQIIEIAGVFRGQVLDVGTDALIIECTGSPQKLHAFEELVRPYGLVELARTGRIAIERGSKAPKLRVVRNAKPAG